MILHSKILGKGQPFLIFHGLFGMLDNWQSQGKYFSENYEVHLVDLRNHGRSFHSDEMNYDVMTQDILEYIEYHSLTNCIVLGHSMGGKAVMSFALKHPEFIHKLIVADIAPKSYPPHHNDIIKGLNSVPLKELKKRSEAEDYLSTYIPQWSVRQFLLKGLFRNGDEYNWRFNLKALTANYTELIEISKLEGVFDKETLFLRGAKSNYIEEQDTPLLKLYFPNHKLETIANAGHWLHAENPKDFGEAINRFL